MKKFISILKEVGWWQVALDLVGIGSAIFAKNWIAAVLWAIIFFQQFARATIERMNQNIIDAYVKLVEAYKKHVDMKDEQIKELKEKAQAIILSKN